GAGLLQGRLGVWSKAQYQTATMAGQMVLLARRPWHFFVPLIQRRRHFAEEGLQQRLTTFRLRYRYFGQPVDQLLGLVGTEHLVTGLSRLFNHLTPQEAAHVLRATGFRSGTRQPLATEWLGANDGADLVTVHVGVAHLDTTGNVLDPPVNAAMNTESQAVALGIDGIDHLVDVLGFKRGHMQNRAENFLFQLFNSAHLKHCRRHEQALLRYIQFLEQLA